MPRGASQRGQPTRAAQARVAAGRLSAAAALAVALLLAYSLLEAGLGVWWWMQLSTVGPCQKDNEVSGARGRRRSL